MSNSKESKKRNNSWKKLQERKAKYLKEPRNKTKKAEVNF